MMARTGLPEALAAAFRRRKKQNKSCIIQGTFVPIKPRGAERRGKGEGWVGEKRCGGLDFRCR